MNRTIRTYCTILLAVAVTVFAAGCKKKERNEVPLEQIEVDRSTNYRYLFREEIDRESEQSHKKSGKPFSDGQ